MEREPVFLTLAETVEIHAYQIEHFGGSDGMRSQEMLESAAGIPSSKTTRLWTETSASARCPPWSFWN